MKSFNYVHSLLSITFSNKKTKVHSNDQMDENPIVEKEEDMDYVYEQTQLKHKPHHHTKLTRDLTHFKSLPSLQTIFKKSKRPLLKRTRSKTSICSTDTKMSTQTSFSLKFTASNDKLNSLISPNVQTTTDDTSFSKVSTKSMEFEALIEEYPSRILKASLTPSLCN